MEIKRTIQNIFSVITTIGLLFSVYASPLQASEGSTAAMSGETFAPSAVVGIVSPVSMRVEPVSNVEREQVHMTVASCSSVTFGSALVLQGQVGAGQVSTSCAMPKLEVRDFTVASQSYAIKVVQSAGHGSVVVKRATLVEYESAGPITHIPAAMLPSFALKVATHVAMYTLLGIVAGYALFFFRWQVYSTITFCQLCMMRC